MPPPDPAPERRNVDSRILALEERQARIERLLEQIRDSLIGSPEDQDGGLRGRVAILEDRLRLAGAVAWAGFVAGVGAAVKLMTDWLAGGGAHR